MLSIFSFVHIISSPTIILDLCFLFFLRLLKSDTLSISRSFAPLSLLIFYFLQHDHVSMAIFQG